jgi:hypothetical protein
MRWQSCKLNAPKYWLLVMTLNTRTCPIVLAGADMTASYTYIPFQPGKYTGPWEDSYPDEPEEIEISAIMYGDIDLFSILNEETIASIENQIHDFETTNQE